MGSILVRDTTVIYGNRVDIPMIRITGKYIKKAGVNVGDKVRIIIERRVDNKKKGGLK